MMQLGGQTPPRLVLQLGYAGLIPQIAALAVLLAHDPEYHFMALAMGYAYAALILSFLGGLWWGLAAQAQEDVPLWLWFAAVAPSLIAFASAWPWATGTKWPGSSLIVLGVALIASLAVDFRLKANGLCPPWWLHLRIPLSIGLGLSTLLMAAFA
ncbi:DUF3429 domain-containing protein [Sphingomonas immobilis]|uniref:DUF3429 domain-containing protein n=1 Tax=Sphingomonas immobilis TaxID=3063997 RepID=A0ABT8ZXC8_9SPHN|nr:DUF3429 domain-containing protein [Sphingomonas sp. CA1-15]MDO7841892.1 DUF3429 domain-containing protein [Sphingomonas sp. CA1-15]